MNKRDSIEFFREIGFEKLIEMGILIPIGSTYQLKGPSVYKLIKLMETMNVDCLYRSENGALKWFLKINGDFLNRYGSKQGHVSQVPSLGDIFIRSNRDIQPFWEGDNIDNEFIKDIEIKDITEGEEAEITQFLKQFDETDLQIRKVLNTVHNYLNSNSVEPLLKLMKEHEISKLKHGYKWYLLSSGMFINRFGGYNNETDYRMVRPIGDVFLHTNNEINPFRR